MDNKIFYDENAAREFLEKLRWPDGPACPHCGAIGAYRLEAKEGSKSGVRPGVLKCKHCRKQFTVKVKTIFEDSHIPLHKWLHAISLFAASKKGISSHQIHRMLGITYKSAWFMTHRIRYAMKKGPLAGMLRGTVEVDETYVGPKGRGYNRGRSTMTKTPVVALVQRNGEARAHVVADAKKETLHEVVTAEVHKSATLMTDEWRAYRMVGKAFKAHKRVRHGAGEYVRGNVYTNTVECFFSLLKRGITGTFHHVSKDHLNRYCDEFTFRWNSRGMNDEDRMIHALHQIEGKRLMYRDAV